MIICDRCGETIDPNNTSEVWETYCKKCIADKRERESERIMKAFESTT